MISEAVAEAKRTSAHAELEADNLIMKATHDAEEYKKARMAEIRENAARRREEILKDGRARAAELRQRGSRNLEKAASLLVSRFRERLHVHS
ncbi:MAG TPA: ATPase [Methanolinea sp.]|nr:ATPase [Methanolinea sp.]HOS82670.1 ATPase [Methanolinea sp.]HQE86257.1 ATPase [Methanolinea sp.]HRU79926.1 ATPase [Methanolinea sp.]